MEPGLRRPWLRRARLHWPLLTGSVQLPSASAVTERPTEAHCAASPQEGRCHPTAHGKGRGGGPHRFIEGFRLHPQHFGLGHQVIQLLAPLQQRLHGVVLDGRQSRRERLARFAEAATPAPSP